MKSSSRLKDFINIRENEVRYSILFTIIFIVLLRYIDFYNDFDKFANSADSFYTCFICAMLGLLGFSLSGIALVSGLFPVSIADEIDKDSGKGSLKHILGSYVFLAQNIAFQCVGLIGIYFATFSERPKVNKYIFWSIVAIELYHVFFIIFYTVSLVSNCIILYEIKNIYEKVSDDKRTTREKATDVQIDFIISTLANMTGTTPEKALDNLYDFVGSANLKDKNEILKYLKDYYCK